MNENTAQNTDMELWRERDDYYADSIHVTAQGGIGINCGGMVHVRPLREWHRLVLEDIAHEAKVRELDAAVNDLREGQMHLAMEIERKDEQIRKLTEALTTYKHRHESGGPLSEIRPDSCRCSACDNARAALQETEG